MVTSFTSQGVSEIGSFSSNTVLANRLLLRRPEVPPDSVGPEVSQNARDGDPPGLKWHHRGMADETSAAERYEQLVPTLDKRWWKYLLEVLVSRGTAIPVVIQVRDRTDGRIVYEVNTDDQQVYGDSIAKDLASLTVAQFQDEYGLR